MSSKVAITRLVGTTPPTLHGDWNGTRLTITLDNGAVLEVYDDQGNYRGDQPMFWVYYPEARTVLSQHQVFNPKNGGSRNSWEDLFEMRYFASYIIKKENVYDRRIQDYLVGVDALYESDNITNEIFDFEQNLWEY